jgi:hypothetical protein
VHEELLRRVVAGGEQERGPVDAVEAEDVLPEQMPDLGPEALEVLAGRVAEGAPVVDERVGPDVGDLLRIPRDRHAPGLRRPADREVAEAAPDEAARLVGAEPRQDEVGARVVERQQPLLVGREAEEPVPLLEPRGLDAVVGALPVDELLGALERLAAVAVEAGVHVLVDVVPAVVPDPQQEVLDEALVPLIARADEEVVLRVQAPGQLSPGRDDAIRVLLRRQPLLRGDARHLVGMLVHPGQEEGLVAALPVVPREDVRRDRRVSVADVRRRVHVVDGCRHVEAHPWKW